MASKANSLQSLIQAKPKEIKIDPVAVQLAPLRTANGNIQMFQSNDPSIQLTSWSAQNANWIDEQFYTHGALLFRGFKVEDNQFYGFANSFANELMDYSEPSTPRTKLSDKIYTSTEYPKEQFIPMHNEHSYSNHWPSKIWFHCVKPSAIGGATPIADSMLIYEKIDPSIREEFSRKQVMYVRNFSNAMDLPWQAVFQTENKSDVEQYCRANKIDFEWKADGGLRTKQVCQAVLLHPRTKQMVWFNQAHLFHISNLEPAVQAYLLETFGEENLPRNTYFGDGTPIPIAYLEEIRRVYKTFQLSFPWQQSDVLMLDNMCYAHGRDPFEGERKILVAMSDPIHYESQPKKADQGASVEYQKSVATARQDTATFYSKLEAHNTDHAIMRYKLAAAYRIMVSEGLDEGGISGHITVRVPGQPDTFWVNPFGLLAAEVDASNLIKVDKGGNVLEGNYPVNVAGFCIHAAIHDAYPDVNCVVHTHSPWGTLFSALNKKIEPIDQNCCLFYENHSLYDTYNGPVNDPDDALKLAKALKGMDIIILRNHGTITCGTTIEAAVMRMVAAERAFRLNILAQQLKDIEMISPEVARLTKEWIGNDLAFNIEFNALLRKVEKMDSEFLKLRPVHFN